MIAPSTPAEVILKAGGIDLLDLMKEGLFAPQGSSTLRGFPVSTGRGCRARGLRIGPLTLAKSLRMRWFGRYGRTPPGGSPARKSATSRRWAGTFSSGPAAGTSARRLPLFAQRRRTLLCDRRRESVPRLVRQPRLRHRSPLDHRHRAGRAGCLGRAHRRERRRSNAPPRGLSPSARARRPSRERSRAARCSPPCNCRCSRRAPSCPSSRAKRIRSIGRWPRLPSRVGRRGRLRAAVVLGAAAPVPHRARAAEALLEGGHIDEASAGRRHARLEGATPLAQNAYKIPLFEALVRRAILEAAARADLSHQPPTE